MSFYFMGFLIAGAAKVEGKDGMKAESKIIWKLIIIYRFECSFKQKELVSFNYI